MSLIITKSCAFTIRTIGRKKLGIYRIIIPRACNGAAVMKGIDGPLSCSASWPAHITTRQVNSSTQAVKAAVEVDKLDDVEHRAVKKTPKPYKTKYRTAINHKHLVSCLIKCPSVAQQIEEMCFQFHVDDEEKVSRLALGKQLEEILSPYFLNCRVILVGSSISGFGLRGCDIDLSFQTHWDPSMRNPKFIGDDLPSVENVDNGKVPVSQIGQFAPKQQLRFVRRVLSAHWRQYPCRMNLVAGRCPILSFQYEPKQVKCDLSFESSSAVSSTKLLLFCGKMDERVIPLSKIINYWAKRADLIGPVDKFKSYAFALMLIYFLQTRKPAILPPLKCILQEADFFKDDDMLWDADLSNDLSKFPKSSNEQTIEELLREFFFFYLFFDFSRTICPLDGCTVSKHAFNQETGSDVPKIELGSSICIQDPFDTAWNVTTGVSYKHCMIFVKELLAVCKIYQDPQIWIPSSKAWALAAVIDKVFGNDTLKKDLVEFSVAKCISAECNEESVNLWRVKTSQAVLKILSYALLFKCDLIKLNRIAFKGMDLDTLGIGDSGAMLDFNNGRTAHTSEQQVNDLPDTRHKTKSAVEPLLIAKCSAIVSTWQGRNNWTEDYFPPEVVRNPLELEHAISQKLYEDKYHQQKQGETDFILQCIEREINGELFLNVRFSPSENGKFPVKGMVFLKEYIPMLIKKICV